MTDALPQLLCAADWLDRGARRPVRYVFRKDGSGYCDREAGPGERPVFEKLLWKLAPATGSPEPGIRSVELQLKFVHARLWTAVEARLVDGEPPGLVLARDPWAFTFLDATTTAQALVADTGAALDDV